MGFAVVISSARTPSKPRSRGIRADRKVELMAGGPIFSRRMDHGPTRAARQALAYFKNSLKNIYLKKSYEVAGIYFAPQK